MTFMATRGQLGNLAEMLAGAVVAVSSSPAHGFSKQSQPAIRLLSGEGVQGDAHCGLTVQHLYQVRRDPTQPNLCQVHLFAVEMLEELAAKGYPLDPGAIGENVLTRGLDLLRLPRGTRLRLGSVAVVEITGLRTPCSRIDKFQRGLQQHLWGERPAGRRGGQRSRRAGVMGIVLIDGSVRAGDPVHLTLPPEPHVPLGPV